MESKNYYLSSYRAIVIGVILITMGVALNFINFDIERSFLDNFQNMVIDFRGIMNFLFSVFSLLFKIGFVLLGYITLKYRKQIIRAKTNDKGFYFKDIKPGNKYQKLFFDLEPLTFYPYSEIKNIHYVENFWRGNYLEIETKSEQKKLIALDILSKSEKKEIYETINKRINKNYD